ncbi:MAG TPA: DUF6690 family protein [Pirellulales bacterium]|nr:DUF6690 family protein [Pirellulales bacterium]
MSMKPVRPDGDAMFLKRSWFALGLAGAIGMPYLFSSSSGLAGLFTTKPAGPEQTSTDGSALAGAALAAAHGTDRAADAAPIVDMGQALRFDVTTAWVLGQWPRVSAGLAQLEMQGYRVPLVTGTRPDDLAGSLTYYFNHRQRVERITFNGSTGDARRLVALLVTNFGFVRVLAGDASLFLYEVKEGGKVKSELRIKPSRIVRADSPHTRFEVSLVIQRPSD